jgi:site-specific recombinase XerD
MRYNRRVGGLQSRCCACCFVTLSREVFGLRGRRARMLEGKGCAMSHRTPVLSYQARHEVLLRFIPAYQQAKPAKKSQLLDQFLEVTGYTRKHAIGPLNHPEKRKQAIQRPRLPFYGSEVQQALFLAWKATRDVCAQRLMPFLSEMIPLLERCGHLTLTEEHRNHLLAMSLTTAKRFLRTQRKPTPHGLSTTQAGPLLKHQIPIRTFHAWNDLRPGFLEADLVAHCGGHTEGSYLYTLTLTDIATGWTECLPLRARTSAVVLAALQRARTLFPFPILGIDTDNGAEFINEDVRAYCEQEHLMFTRRRPEQKNDQCYVEEKNRSVVRQVVEYDRLVGEQTYQQLRELYRALRLSVNCFQPSMKLLSKQQEGTHLRRIYDPAKTPLQRLLLSGVLSAATQDELRVVAARLDPLVLSEQIEQLQHAVWRCESRTAAPCFRLMRFAVETELFSTRLSTEETPGPTTEASPSVATLVKQAPFLNWQRSRANPFAGEWECLLDLVRAHPECRTRVLFDAFQCLYPGRFDSVPYSAFRSAVSKIRAFAREQEAWPDLWPWEVIHGPTLASAEESGGAHGAQERDDEGEDANLSSFVSDCEERTGALASPASTSASAGSSVSPPQDTARSHSPHLGGERRPPRMVRRRGHERGRPRPTVPETALDGAIERYLEDLRARKRVRKTLEWHQAALRSLREHLGHQQMSEPQDITLAQVQDWLVALQTECSITGAVRAASTIQTYARSARAFCAFLVRQGELERTPFVKGMVPKADRRHPQIVDPKMFEQLLDACGPSGELADQGASRNRTLLWLFLETGLSVSEACALRVRDVDRAQGQLLIQGIGPKARWVTLGEQASYHLLFYLDAYRLKAVGGITGSEPLFLSERHQPLVPNTITLLLARLHRRAGLTEQQISPTMLRDTFVVRYLQAGRSPSQLRKVLGLDAKTPVVRYQKGSMGTSRGLHGALLMRNEQPTHMGGSPS